MPAAIRRFCLCLFVLCALPLAAQDYRAFADDIAQRLDAANTLYQQGNTDEAKKKVQMAYFEVFENLEGPIRINISAQKSAEMEAEFGNIRRLIGNGARRGRRSCERVRHRIREGQHGTARRGAKGGAGAGKRAQAGRTRRAFGAGRH